MISEACPSLPISTAACELLSVSLQITFYTAVGGTVQNTLPPQLSLLILFENYSCADLPTALVKKRALASEEMADAIVENVHQRGMKL